MTSSERFNNFLTIGNFLLAVIQVIAALVGIALVLWYKQEPQPKIEIFSNKPVFSINEEVSELEIFFQKKNIRQSRKSLSLFTLKFGNFGNKAITPLDFNENKPFSISVQNGELLRADFCEASDSRLMDKIANNVRKKINTLIFPDFFLDSGQFMVIKLLILHDESSLPTIDTGGVIDHVNVEIVNSLSEKVAENLLYYAVSGTWIIQIIRVLLYGIMMMIITGCFILIWKKVRN